MPTAADTTQPSQAAEAQPEARQATEVSGDTESLAREVIRGKYGNGAVRKQRLGGSYAEVQAKVNEMYRNGLVN